MEEKFNFDKMENNTMKPILSVIIPVYNTPVNYLEECLQSLKPIEINPNIILVNDGSTLEETLKYLDFIKNQYTVVHKENGGLPSARNAGVRYAIKHFGTNKHYIYTLDSDDKINPDFFSEAYQVLLNNPEIDVLYSDRQNFGDDDRYVKTIDFNKAYLFFVGNIVQAMIFFKTEVWEEVNGYNESFFACEDYDFAVRAALSRQNFYYFPKPIFYYRIIYDGKSLSQSKSGRFGKLKKEIRSNIRITDLTKDDLHEYIIMSFRNNKLNFFKLFLTLISERIIHTLIKMKVLKSKYFIDIDL